MLENDKNYFSDDNEEVDPNNHNNLLQSISRLGVNQHIKEPTRTEPSLKVDEFHLSKTRSISQVKIKDNIVLVDDLVKILNKDKSNAKVTKELKAAHWGTKVLPKPLEKPAADRLERTIGYDRLKSKLKKWNAVVAKNRQSDHQVFPLDYEEIHLDTTKISKPKPANFSVKSELQLEMEALEEKYKALKGIQKETVDEEEEERKIQEKLTRDELIAKRRELAYLRMQQSQKSAKARLHNKIKSKKFHKLLKKEKLKEQLKEFELLQKTDPETAMKQLEKIEKSRIMERASLRHKNTGTWAKNLQVRAKYDRDARKDLAEQLAISRELTQKHKQGSDNENESDNNKESDAEMDGENMDDGNDDVDPFNPWVKVGKKKNKNETDEILMGYKKYWLERNENEKAIQDHKKQIEEINKENGALNSIEENVEDDLSNFNEKSMIKLENDAKSKLENENENLKQMDEKSRKIKKKSKSINLRKKGKKGKKSEVIIENGWIVEELGSDDCITKNKSDSENISDNDFGMYDKKKVELLNKDIDDIFDEAEDKIQEKFARKLKNVKDIMEEIEATRKQKLKNEANVIGEEDELENLKNLSFKNQNQRPDFDQELNELPMGKTINIEKPLEIFSDKKIKNNENDSKTNDQNNDSIDPNDFANIKPKRLHSLVNGDSKNYINEEVGDEDDIDPDLSRQMTIAEAFEDDDVVVDFTKEKDNKNKQDNEVDLTMPGWGSWAGCGINSRNKKRLVLKFPEKEKRRDDNKGNLYINETVNEQLKDHLVSDLPFPFTSVKDYEASIRAPIGRTFVPETAFRVLTRPSVETKMGHIIQPMNESILVKKPFSRRKHIVDKRIGNMLKESKKNYSKKS
ncbi:U3 small nucleolar RNA-associated protein 14 homolog B [Condylostylus longicornis]|uniref:U3 small nucleolar RNA-associated protein 14 homolog B n=1 Tax=Condylostylus longicornis TaxID=2530218 RepID=UPI00244DE281|nr:U3 small nucleolar RNA-associated protein 14 homolog B [Condylostylus longicornis]